MKKNSIPEMQMPTVLTIAGSDSGAGAGIQADLKTFQALGVFGTSAITALTAQNTKGVEAILEIPKEFIEKQIDSVMTDIRPLYWKTGMLFSKRTVGLVSKKAKQYKIKFLVVDPVMISKSGNKLLKEDAKQSLINKLFPLAFLIAPNLDETKEIIKEEINSIEKMKKAAVLLHKTGAKNILVKGGHLKSSFAIDVFYNGREFKIFSKKRVSTKNSHGTGCTFSSAITAFLAKGNNLENSISKAKEYITKILKSSKDFNIGEGHGPLILN